MPTASKLYYFASRAGSFLRPPVLLIHGAGGHQLSWPPQIRRLRELRVFAIDLPGHGRSEGIGHHRVEDYVEAVLPFMEDIGINSAVWIGHSMGGAIALDAAIRHPERVLGLGLLGSGARLRVDPAILRNMGQPTTFPAALALLGERSFSDRADPRLKELALERMAEVRPAVLQGDLLACEAFDLSDHLAEISVPTLVVCGAQDRVTPPSHSEYLRDQIPGALLRIIPNAGHMVMMEQPEQSTAALEGFVDSIPYRPGSPMPG